jgi:Arc/MetJ-type ribon-helix-helix transcriptional regulator
MAPRGLVGDLKRSQTMASWYDSSMTSYEKVAVSVPTQVLASAREAVSRGDAESLSAYVTAALAEKRERDDLDAVLARMATEDGEPSEQDLAWVQRVLAR